MHNAEKANIHPPYNPSGYVFSIVSTSYPYALPSRLVMTAIMGPDAVAFRGSVLQNELLPMMAN